MTGFDWFCLGVAVLLATLLGASDGHRKVLRLRVRMLEGDVAYHKARGDRWYQYAIALAREGWGRPQTVRRVERRAAEDDFRRRAN